MSHPFWIFFLSTVITSINSDICIGFSNKDLQLQAAVRYTKTEEFYNLFEKIQATTQWHDYRNYIREKLKIDIADVIMNADSTDTLKSLKRKIERKIPLRIKIHLLLAPGLFDVSKLGRLYNALNVVSEFDTLKRNLCQRNVDLDELLSEVM